MIFTNDQKIVIFIISIFALALILLCIGGCLLNMKSMPNRDSENGLCYFDDISMNEEQFLNTTNAKTLPIIISLLPPGSPSPSKNDELNMNNENDNMITY